RHGQNRGRLQTQSRETHSTRDGGTAHRDSRRWSNVTGRDLKTGKRTQMKADYCISNIPLPILSKIENNFADDFDKAVAQCVYDPTCKLGWQANQRFWENDQNQIYGGISYTDDPITQMWYPSYDYFTKNGTLTGVYNYDEDAIRFGNMSLEER